MDRSQKRGGIMRKILAAGLVILAACASSPEEEDKDIVSNRVGDWETSLSSTGGSVVRGTAKAQSVGVGTGVNISIEGAAASAEHPWHVHVGTCGSGGAVVGSANAYPPLLASSSGRASANTSIGVALRENERYHVNVHRSPTDMTVISCGNLSND
jgi:hypothetical protein